MAKNFKVGIILEGDGRGGIKAVRGTREELQKLARQSRQTTDQAGKLRQAYDRTGAAARQSLARVGILGAVAGGALALLVKRSFETADSLGKIADTINTDTKALAGLRLAADLTGLSAGEMDKAVERMVRQIGEARRGSKLAADAIASLGLNLDTFSELRADEQFALISDRIQGVENRADQAAIATALFGRNGVRLLNTLELGPEKLRAITEELDALNVALSREEVAAIEAANDAITRLQKVGEGLGNTIAVQIAPFITDISDRLYQASLDSDGFQKQVTAAMDNVAGAIGFVGDAVHSVNVLFKALEVGAVGSSVLLSKLFLTVSEGAERIINSRFLAINLLIDAAQALGSDIENIGVDFSDLGAYRALEDFAAAGPELARHAMDELKAILAEPMPSQSIADWMAEVRAKADEAGPAVQQLFKVIEGGGESTAKTTDKIQDQIDALRDQITLVESGLSIQEASLRLKLADQGATQAQIEEYLRLNGVLEAHAAARENAKANDEAERAAAKARLDALREQHQRTAERIEGIYFDLSRAIVDDFDNVGDAILGSFKQLLVDMALEAGRNAVLVPLVASAGNLAGVGEGALNGILGQLATGDLAEQFGKEAAQANLDSAADIGAGMGAAAGPVIAAALGNVVGFQIGAALGERLGIDPTAAGASVVLSPELALANLLTAGALDAAWEGLMGGDRELRTQDLTVSLSQTSLDAWTRTVVRESGGLVGGSSRDIRIEQQTAVAEGLAEALAPLLATAGDAARLFGTSLAGFELELTESIKGASEDEITEIIAGLSGEAADAIARAVLPGLDALRDSGETLAQTLGRVVAASGAVHTAFTALGLSPGSGAGLARMADGLVAAAGGVSQFNSAIDTLVSDFASEAERAAFVNRQVDLALGKLADHLPATREGLFELFRTMGPNAQGVILANIDLLDDYYGLLADNVDTTALQIRLLRAQGDELGALALTRQQELAAASGTEQALLLQIHAAEDAARAEQALEQARDEAARTAEQFAGSLRSASRSLLQQIAELRGESVAALDASLLAQDIRGAGSLQALLDLVPGLQQAMTGQTREAIDAARAAEQRQLDAINRQTALQRAAAQEQAGLLREQTAQLRSLLDASEGLRDFVAAQRVGDSTAFSLSQRLAMAQADFGTTLAAARGGSATAAQDLPSLATTLIDLLASSSTSRQDYQLAVARVLGDLEQTATAIDRRSPELQALQAQLARLEEIRDNQPAQVDSLSSAYNAQIVGLEQALAGRLETVTGILDLIRGASLLSADEQTAAIGVLQRALIDVLEDGQLDQFQGLAGVRSALAAVGVDVDQLTGVTGGGLTHVANQTQAVKQATSGVDTRLLNMATTINQNIHHTNMGIGNVIAGINGLGGLLQNSNGVIDLLNRIRMNLVKQNQAQGLPAYAMGGIADRPSIFGEAGPEAAVPLPDGRTIPVTLSMPPATGNAALVRELTQLRAEVAQLRREQRQGHYAIAKNTQSVDKTLRRWDDGDRARVHVQQDEGESIAVEGAA